MPLLVAPGVTDRNDKGSFQHFLQQPIELSPISRRQVRELFVMSSYAGRRHTLYELYASARKKHENPSSVRRIPMSHHQPSPHQAIDEPSYVGVAVDEVVRNPLTRYARSF